MQPVYRVSAGFAPEDNTACVNDQKSLDHTITLQIDERHPQNDTIVGSTKAEIAWPAGDSECATSVRITDVVAPPPHGNGQQRFVAVVVLAVSWAPHAEAARYFAAFVKLP
jgi:hypothetical protein